MATPINAATRVFDWGAAAMMLAGERESGDRYVVNTFDGGALVAVIDALGHGHAAALAADVAVRTLSQHEREAPDFLIERCHDQMRGTRGAAISLACFDSGRRVVSWLGIGNVTGVLMVADGQGESRPRELLVRGGVVGDRIPEELNPSVFPIAPGDTLIIATDGVRHYFTEILPTAAEPQQLAERILNSYAKHSDDAAVLVFRFNGDA